MRPACERLHCNRQEQHILYACTWSPGAIQADCRRYAWHVTVRLLDALPHVRSDAADPWQARQGHHRRSGHEHVPSPSLSAPRNQSAAQCVGACSLALCPLPLWPHTGTATLTPQLQAFRSPRECTGKGCFVFLRGRKGPYHWNSSSTPVPVFADVRNTRASLLRAYSSISLSCTARFKPPPWPAGFAPLLKQWGGEGGHPCDFRCRDL